MATLVLAHLARAGARDSPLPERLQQATRPKLSEIDGEEALVCEVTDSPWRVLRQMSRAIAEARFTGKGDREVVQLMLAELEWIMRTAFDQLLEVLCEGDAEPDPSTVAGRHGGCCPRAGYDEVTEGRLRRLFAATSVKPSPSRKGARSLRLLGSVRRLASRRSRKEERVQLQGVELGVQ